jgi:hypothetical protein
MPQLPDYPIRRVSPRNELPDLSSIRHSFTLPLWEGHAAGEGTIQRLAWI